MSIRFLDSEEREQDRVRRRVFQALREERARLAERPGRGTAGSRARRGAEEQA